MTEDEIVNLIPLNKENEELANQILAETDLKKTQELTHLFNLNQAKRNAIRVLKLNSLLDKVSDQMIERFEKRPDNFSNTDLLNYMTTVQSSIDRANKSLNLIDESPAIKINVENVNVDAGPVLDRDSRERVADALKAIMSFMEKQNQDVIEPENIIIEEEKEEGESLLNGDERDNNN